MKMIVTPDAGGPGLRGDAGALPGGRVVVVPQGGVARPGDRLPGLTNERKALQWLVLEGRDLTKTYREGRHEVPVLHGVSLSVARGEVVALEGPSGSGKTTLLCILGCLLTPTGGRVVIDGQEIDAGVPTGYGRSAAARSALCSSNSTCSRR